MVRHFFRSVVVIASLGALALVLACAAPTLRGARPADGTERGLLVAATRLAAHTSPYTETAVTATPPMPVLPFLLSLLDPGEKPTLRHLRMIALLAAAALAILVAALVQEESGSWTLAAAAAGLAILGTALVCAPPGVARTEPLALVLLLLGAAALRHTVGVTGTVVAAIPFVLAWFVDAQAVWGIAGCLTALALTDGRRFLTGALATGVLGAAAFALLSRVFGPWFNFAAWDGAWGGFQPSAQAALHFLSGTLLGNLSVCALVTLLSCAMATRPWEGRRGIWTCLAAGALLGALVATQRAGSDASPLTPCIVLAFVIGPLALQRVARHLSASFDNDSRDGEGIVLAALALQFLLLGSLATTAPWVTTLLQEGLRI